MQKHIVIIGNGISGISCARYIRKLSNHRITVISGESEHFFSRTALMYVYMGHMRYKDIKPYEDFFWDKNRIELIYNYVSEVDPKKNQLKFDDGETLNYDTLVIATGSKPNKFGWPGQDSKGVQGLYSLQDLSTMEKNTNQINRGVIIGGGLIGIEMAEMLDSRKIPVTLLVRENRYWGGVLPKEEGEMINRHIREHGIDLRLETELKEIQQDEIGRVKNVITNKSDIIPCEFVGLAVGVSPNVHFLKNSGIELDKGVLVNQNLETNIPGIYAIGDCAQFKVPLPGRAPIEQVWYTGKMHGETLAFTLCKKNTLYQPGHWFNSSKFFDIEFQTYGKVSAEPQDDEESFYWEHANGKISVRLVYRKNNHHLIGVNAMGYRLRHPVIDRWLTENRTVEYAITHLRDANFNPEFYKKHENEIIDNFNQIHQTHLKSAKKSWKRILNLS